MGILLRCFCVALIAMAAIAVAEESEAERQERESRYAKWAEEREPINAKLRETVEKFLGGMNNPEVTAYRLVPGDEPLPDDTPREKIIGDQYIDKSIRINEDDAKNLRTALMKKENYGYSWAGCYEPGFALRWKDAAHSLEIIICMECIQIEFFMNGKRRRVPLSQEGKYAFFEYYFKFFPDPKLEAEVAAERKKYLEKK